MKRGIKMFIVDAQNRNLNVKFYSRMVKNDVGKVVRETTCKLATVDNSKSGKERYTNVAVGVSRQNSKDRDSRPEGRRVAFGNAIKAFSKDERASMWRQYDPTMTLEV
jgi:hypothetical protein